MTHIHDTQATWLDPEVVENALKNPNREPARVREVLAKARELQGLNFDDVATLASIDSDELRDELFATARYVKEEIYGKRMVLFAPLYISNVCGNECSYCAFRASNKSIQRHALNMEEIKQEALCLIDQGQKRVLLVAGEGYSAANGGFNYVLDAIDAVYSVEHVNGNIRRLNVNVAPLSIDEFKALKAREIGTYQLFQETYHRPTYAEVHLRGKKADFDWRASAMDRAMQAGIDDVGLGALFGLYDWRFELMSVMQHIAHLEERFGVGAHTISVPRIEPAEGSEFSDAPPYAVTDDDFKKLIAILRLAVPYTGLILSTRESAEMRREAIALGISQISAGSRTNPGGYVADANSTEQFQLGDHRTLEEVVRELASTGFIPSFCTACYRMGRTGKDFMDLAKPGLIKRKCDPNAVTTLQEYLCDYAEPETQAAGETAILQSLDKMDDKTRRNAEKMLNMIRNGRRDIYC
ncbi:MAG: [FeFe] hydrogenase H-cluster radical SAM maturase HydG [Paludibacterium sp.]|uniref:[FeFe] hydrogenase H-cluster radical SAM maturase HydG n=1 Tax=Paludibacterium sp. TaxID=1917523 RepID=UPI0025F0E54B|nr:[FeFe] hydrogenase H-cluster radical SAM maturase HydG [Paludibacterium sp.]MBV8048140.1 [FeFe] hydrogenase H-cluster radical SAM maturase HydG [Paludibacterium sp.]MBV8648651.1 [FeFe] hydrogenase H-cluster radical SAM maturase HydG [Paludibacterium sp.]